MAGENRRQDKPHTGLKSHEDGVAQAVYATDGRKLGKLKSLGYTKKPNAQQTSYLRAKRFKPAEEPLPPLDR